MAWVSPRTDARPLPARHRYRTTSLDSSDDDGVGPAVHDTGKPVIMGTVINSASNVVANAAGAGAGAGTGGGAAGRRRGDDGDSDGDDAGNRTNYSRRDSGPPDGPDPRYRTMQSHVTIHTVGSLPLISSEAQLTHHGSSASSASCGDDSRGRATGKSAPRRGTQLKRTLTFAKRPQLTLRQKVWQALDDPYSSRLASAIGLLMVSLIITSTIVFVVETEDTLREHAGGVFEVVEAVCIILFTIEVTLRLASCPSFNKYFRDVFNWVDIIAVVPFYVEQLLPDAAGAGGFGVIRVVRLVRVARVIKVSRYSTSVKVFSHAMASSARPLTMLIFLVSIAMVMFSSGVYYAEWTADGCRDAMWFMPDRGPKCSSGNGFTQIEDTNRFTRTTASGPTEVVCECTYPNPFDSIPATFWWCLVTMTTVGYGDLVPITGVGKIVAVMAMISGIIILALPITVIGTNFTRVIRKMQQEAVMNKLRQSQTEKQDAVNSALTSLSNQSTKGGALKSASVAPAPVSSGGVPVRPVPSMRLKSVGSEMTSMATMHRTMSFLDATTELTQTTAIMSSRLNTIERKLDEQLGSIVNMLNAMNKALAEENSTHDAVL